MVSSRSKVHAWPTIRRTARPSTMSRRPWPFNRLPIELVHHILRMAAGSSRRSSLDICLVSSWAHRIARPHLFHTIVITDTIALDKCLGCIVNHMPNSNLTVGSLVDGVWMAHHYHHMSRILRACANVTHLALGSRCINRLLHRSSPGKIAGEIIFGSQDLHLTVLDNSDTYDVLGPLYSGTGLGGKSPIFDQITHMRLIVAPDGYLFLKRLELFGRLSHVSVPYYFGGQHYLKELRCFLSLRALT